MDSDLIKKSELTENKIYIIGTSNFQNELLADYIYRHTGGRCFTGKSLSKLPNENRKENNQDLILFNCGDTTLENLQTVLMVEFKDLLPRFLIALYNLKPETGIEKKALNCGVRGLFYEHDQAGNLVKGICAILKGELWVTRKVMTECLLKNEAPRISGKKGLTSLTGREEEILTLIAMGTSNEAIADKLCISPHTVKTHAYNIFKKINVSNRLQAALWAAKHL